jgi:RimJ/RimL family protein N-acetyltransferase
MRIRSGDVTLVAFDESSTDTLFAIRNHPSVRAGMLDSTPLTLDSHKAWVYENLLRERRVHLFIIENLQQPLGIALLRNLQPEEAEIGVMVVDAVIHPLVCYKAAHLIGYYAFEILDLRRVYSRVPRRNQRALEFNLHCGLQSSGTPSADYHELVLTQSESRSHQTHKKFRAKYGIEVSADPASD